MKNKLKNKHSPQNCPITLTTACLILRPWCSDDFEPFSKINADSRVMKYFPACLSVQESDQLAMKLKTRIEENGWGIWAVTLIESGQFIGGFGLIKLTTQAFSAPFTPAVELVWRLSFDQWEKGYEEEMALAVLRYGFESLQLHEIVSFTALQNLYGRHIMEKIGMQCHSEDNFDHPWLPNESPFKRHALYRIAQEEWNMNFKSSVDDEKS